MSKTRWALAARVTAVVLCVLAFLLAGCGERRPEGENAGEGSDAAAVERQIQLQTLAQGQECEYGRFDEVPTSQEAPPECLVIEDAEGLKRLLYLANLELPYQDVDFSQNVVIAAMQGPKNTSGYAISIQSLRQTGTEVRVLLDLVEPAPGSVTAQMLTSPYHLVLARRSDFQPRGELRFSFEDGSGRRLGTVSAAI